jgi:hypothetical protein
MQEVCGQGHEAAFSQKSDSYAVGCTLYRFCTLAEPIVVDDIKPRTISFNYSIELLSLISSMISSERGARPTASQFKAQIGTITLQLYELKGVPCHVYGYVFPDRSLCSSAKLRTAWM